MSKPEFTSVLTLQSTEGRQEECVSLLKEAFDDPLILSSEIFCSYDDPEIIMAIHNWPSFGAFQGFMEKSKNHEIFKNSGENVEYIRITNWKSIS